MSADRTTTPAPPPRVTRIIPAARTRSIPSLSTRVAAFRLAALATAPEAARVVVIGTAGSGKTSMLRAVRATLGGRAVTLPPLDSSRLVGSLPADSVLLVDDAHMLGEATLQALTARAADPDAGIVLACRPWPHSAALAEVVRILERARPAVVLGHVAHADLDAHLADLERALDPVCADAILELSGGVAWIVSEALAIHDDDACPREPDHLGIMDALQDVIAHRVRTTDPRVRDGVELLCLAASDLPARAAADEDTLRTAHAAGLLPRNGTPVPAVRHAVRATMSVDRLIELYAAAPADTVSADHLRDRLGGIRDARVADALLAQADAAVALDPRRAQQLYRAAREAGAGMPGIAVREAEAAWALGDVDRASALLDQTQIDQGDAHHARAVELSAAIWAARGLMDMSDAVYRSTAPHTGEQAARAAIAALGVADRDRVLEVSAPAARTMPSTLTVALDLLARGMRTSVTGPAEAAINALVRASEMYSSSSSTAPITELPAVIAALTAINLGEIDVAEGVLDDACRARQGGAWAQQRLQLWRAWVAVQQERPHDAEALLQAARAAGPMSARERLFADATVVALARRYSDTPGTIAAWRHARDSLIGAQFDLFSAPALGEFVVTAARVGEPDRMQAHFAHALAQMQQLGSPPIWSAHLHWTGIQQGILCGRPDDLRPHARGLVAASSHNRLAAMMAQAGRVWTAVLAGSVDAEAVETAAYGLATVGLAWDGARLAGHGAGRTEDRRVISRLLACARQLHPRDEARPTEEDGSSVTPASPSAAALSVREREVAVLVLQGKTYVEIGESIFISPRTAEHHIARIRRRLGATTRSDLITKLRLVLEESGDAHTGAHDTGGAGR